MTDYINVLQQFDKYIKRAQLIFEEEGLTGRKLFDSLIEEAKQILNNLNDPSINEPIDNLKIVSTSSLEVDKLGIGELVSLYTQSDMSPSVIVNALHFQGYADITKKDIEDWLKSVNGRGLLDRPDIKGFGSVFDAEVQLQGLFERLKELEGDIEEEESEYYLKARTTKHQVKREILSEERQVIKDASSLAKAIASKRDFDDFKRIMIEEINKENSQVALRIWNRLKEASQRAKTFKQD